MNDRRSDLWSRNESTRRHTEGDPRLCPPLCEHRQSAIGAAAGGCDQALRDFLLEHQRQARPPWRPVIASQPAGKQRRADVIGQVGNDMGARSGQRCGIDRHRIAVDHA